MAFLPRPLGLLARRVILEDEFILEGGSQLTQDREFTDVLRQLATNSPNTNTNHRIMRIRDEIPAAHGKMLTVVSDPP